MKSYWFDLYLFLDFVLIFPKEIVVLILCLELSPSTVCLNKYNTLNIINRVMRKYLNQNGNKWLK